MRLPRPGRRSRLLILAYGVAVFLWLSIEDIVIWPVTLFGLGLATIIMLVLMLKNLGGRTISARSVPFLSTLTGALIGLGSSLAVAGLMFFKNARHGHLFPDYPVEMMLAILQRAPAWTVAGGLIGLSLGLVWLARRREVATI